MNDHVTLFVPGRLCLFGEHTDWAGQYRAFNADIPVGRTIVTGIEQGLYAEAERAEDFSISYEAVGGGSFSCPMDAELLRQTACGGGYDAYVAGVASYVCETMHVGGVHIRVTRRDLPIRKGLSSSAAVCVLVARAFDRLYDLNLSTPQIMDIAYWGEQRTPSRCGRMDQACAYGKHPVVMTFDGQSVTTERIRLKAPLYFTLADLNSGKDTVRILSDLSHAYPFAEGEAEARLHALLGEDNLRITDAAIRAMGNGDTAELGRLMTESQRLFDEKAAPLCPSQLTAPVLHRVLNDDVIRAHSLGGKGVGSQGDGTVQFLAKDKADQDALQARLLELGCTPYAFTLEPERSVRKAVIAVAGFGTRMYPQTRFIKKEFCPVVDRDGLVKPALLVLLEELDTLDIQKICLVIHPKDKELYESLFRPLTGEHLAKLPKKMREYESRLLRVFRKIEFAYQSEARGFGHAVLQAADFADGEPVLLLLGDTIYESRCAESCTQQLIHAFECCGGVTVGVKEILPRESGSFGVLCGAWEDDRQKTMLCTKMVEKPTPDVARESLMMKTGAGEKLYGVFGAYILTRDVFDRLRCAADNGLVSARGEIELTDALAYIAAECGGLTGCVIDGESFDLGNPEAYRYAVSHFGKPMPEAKG